MKRLVLLFSFLTFVLAIQAVDYENSVLGKSFYISKNFEFDANGNKTGEYKTSMVVKVGFNEVISIKNTKGGKAISDKIRSHSLKAAGSLVVVCCVTSTSVFNFYFDQRGKFVKLYVRLEDSSFVWYP